MERNILCAVALLDRCTGRAEPEALRQNIVGMGEDYCSWRNVGDAGNVPVAHILLGGLYTGMVRYEDEGGREQLT